MPSALVWPGEHWILYLREIGQSENSGSISLYHTYYSPAGQGTVAFVQSNKSGLGPTLIAETTALADFVIEKVVAWKSSPFKRNIPIVKGNFLRSGDIRSNSKWRIETDFDVVEAEWRNLESEVVIDRPLKSGAFTIINSILFFSAKATIEVNGKPVIGNPFMREGWRSAIGRPGSSCCFALAETMMGSI